MLKVATSNVVEGPLKLLLPSGHGKFPFSILGLGDVAIPGLFAALMLRFDIFVKRTLQESETSRTSKK